MLPAPRFIPAARTLVSAPDMLAAIAVVTPELARSSRLLLLAQWALETGRGAHCMNFNAAGIKGTPGGSDGHNWTFYATTEVLHGTTVRFEPPSAERAPEVTAANATTSERTTCFRAYENLALGAQDYVALLRRRYAKAWDQVCGGDPARFAAALKAGHYFTADLDDYTRGLVRLVDELERETFTAEALRTLGVSSVRAFQAARGLTADGIVGPKTRAALRLALLERS